MWSSEQSDLEQMEALVRDAAWLPQPTTVFRNRVLATVAQQQKQARWWERSQYVASLVIAASLLWFLPGMMQALPEVRPTAVATTEHPDAVPTTKPWSLIDDYEWGLVQAALAKQSHSAGLIHGLL